MKNFWIASLFALLISACGGQSNVGNQKDAAPIAQASVFGANINTSDRVTVRSGSDVLLSGQNSEGVDDPLLEFEWKQVDSSIYQVALFERTSNAVVFTAPQIPAGSTNAIELEFELTVEDADGVKATDSIIVDVLPASDNNHFLSRPRTDETFAILVVPDNGVTLDTNVPVSVTIEQHARWTDRQGASREIKLSEKVLSGVVPAGAITNITDTSNEYFLEPIPLLDADEVNQNFQSINRDGRLEQEHLETAELLITITMAQQAPGDLRVYLARNGELGFELLDNAAVQTSVNRLTFNSHWLSSQVGIESRISADNYYKCIDPFDEARTLDGWLSQSGFVDGATDIVHTSYVNNFDLNFGRDMFVRRDTNGNVYSYVTNYPTLENIFSSRNDFAVVVMEFSPAPTGQCGDGTFTANDGKKIVKFYAYVPDTTTGEYVRAPTMNFDGRGERALPGVCIACHFGDTNIDDFNVADHRTIDATAADLNSSFMIWDLDAFLYTSDSGTNQTDPVYAANSISDEVTQRYSRSNQEAAFREQNQAVMHTFTYDINQLKRFETPIKLLHGLYGNSNQTVDLNFGTVETPLNESELLALKQQVAILPNNNFNGMDYIQPGWASQEALYHKVFARNCRMCHAQIGEQIIDFDSYDEFINNERLVPYVYELGLMPLSRLTMDRFWTDFYGEQSSAEFLRSHLNTDNNPANDVAADLIPGAPIAIVTPEENTQTAADVIVDFDEEILFDGTASLFSNAYQWRVNGVLSSTDDKFVYRANEPGEQHEITFLAASSNSLVASKLELRQVRVRNNTPMIENVPMQSMIEGDTLDIDIFNTLCPQGESDSVACRTIFGDILPGQTPRISIVGSLINGRISSIDNGTVSFISTGSEADGSASFNFTLTDSFGEVSNAANINIAINSLSGPQIVGPDTCTTNARTFANNVDFPTVLNTVQCPDPSLNDIVAGGFTAELVSVDGRDLRTGASVLLTGGNIHFTPARFFVGQESFTYTIQDNSPSAKASTGTVVVDIAATQTYTNLSTGAGVFATTGDEGCVDCHTGSLAGAPNWLNPENVRLAATNDSEQPYGNPELSLSEPTSTQALLGSILFRKACDYDGSHPGGNRLCLTPGTPNSVADLNANALAILRWLEEGAQNN